MIENEIELNKKTWFCGFSNINLFSEEMLKNSLIIKWRKKIIQVSII